MLLNIILPWGLGAASLVTFFFLRILPIWPVRQQGCDAYYFLLCIEKFKKNKRLPIILPGYYLLEPDEQWYPPGFILFCALFPYEWLQKYYWIVNTLLELLPAAALFTITQAFAGAWFAAIAVAIYAIQPGIIQEYASLTSRPFGALLQMSFLVAAFIWTRGSVTALFVAVIIGALLIYSHKLSLQLLWFLVPLLALLSRNLNWLWPLAGAYALAFAIRPSLFLKIQRAHVDIVRFWSRNWPWLGAHAVRQSPIYGDAKTFTNQYARKGFQGSWTFLKDALHQNYWILFLAPGLIWYPVLSESAQFAVCWVLGTYLWAAATYFVYPLRSLGLGRQYFKFACLPVFFMTAVLLNSVGRAQPWLWGLAMICFFLNWRYYLMVHRSYRRSKTSGILQVGRIDADLENVIKYILTALCDRVRLLVLPYYLSDLMAYRTRRAVAWGTHGYGFRNIERQFPILRAPLADIVSSNRISHLVVDTNYVRLEELHDLPSGRARSFGHFVVYRIDRRTAY